MKCLEDRQRGMSREDRTSWRLFAMRKIDFYGYAGISHPAFLISFMGTQTLSPAGTKGDISNHGEKIS